MRECRSCGLPIILAKLPGGNWWVPLDPDPHPDAPMILLPGSRVYPVVHYYNEVGHMPDESVAGMRYFDHRKTCAPGPGARTARGSMKGGVNEQRERIRRAILAREKARREGGPRRY